MTNEHVLLKVDWSRSRDDLRKKWHVLNLKQEVLDREFGIWSTRWNRLQEERYAIYNRIINACDSGLSIDSKVVTDLMDHYQNNLTASKTVWTQRTKAKAKAQKMEDKIRVLNTRMSVVDDYARIQMTFKMAAK